MYNSIIEYKRARYLWIALTLLVICTLLYLSQGEMTPPNGGTWQGYVLGTLGAVLIVWLALLGVRKRSYASDLGTVQGWVSAHVYLGGALLVLATLHCAFQFGANVHTLAYVLMCLVIFSGFYGLFVYLRYPEKMAKNRASLSFDRWLEELDELDKRGRDLAQKCDADVQSVVSSAIQRTVLGGGLLSQLLGADRSRVIARERGGSGSGLVANKNQQAVIDLLVDRIPQAVKREEAQNLQEVLYVFGRRSEVLRRLRREIGLQARLKVWLYVHIPLTIALLCALAIHIFSVFFYW